MLPSRTEQPVLLIIAGPNGSGKSSVYANADLEMEGRSVWIVNPDLLAARISKVEAKPLPEANLTAVQRIEAWLEASIKVHKTIGVETVLSTGKYRRLVEVAKEIGFAIWFLYVVLDSPERSIERIKLRVAKGGHPVPDDKVRQRYQRSLEQFPWFLEQADKAWIWDNSGASPKTIGEKSDGVIELDESALEAVARAVQSIATE
ncbi:zeta toxin family protein [Pararhizobium sp. YC-54]|uniref:zeta toxin family protein n=1 Tax=Pararhizobium sp. YC-54 TaxID=2986920 RepID=UPI0021F743E2|nr:zeta toxin family protein [Pararhizobium sp. YC-54]MCW0001919.1 zeta toxin family protein [Pararhizobium sp. YC-54]